MPAEAIPDGSLADLLEHRLQDREAHDRSKVAPMTQQVIERTIGALTVSPSFTGRVREEFESVVTSVVRFLDVRQNAEPSHAQYLFRADAQEKDLEADLMQWFGSYGLYGVNVQARNIGGGRIDLVLTFEGFRFILELKRDGSDTTAAGLKQYLPQASTYQVTDVPVGMLIVLDLTGTPPAHILDNVWVERVPATDPGGTERFMVVVRVPGNRKVPSSL